MGDLRQLELFADAAGPGGEAPAPAELERQLLAAALAVGARSVAGWSDAEEGLAAGLPGAPAARVDWLRRAIRRGDDPLGRAFAAIRGAESRRAMGATYTPASLVRPMLGRAAAIGTPARVVDPGAGSGRFLAEAGRRFPRAGLVGVELDPVAAVLARANLAALGMAGRARVVLGDYRSVDLGVVDGPTLFVGNPPYVRHHGIGPEWKAWLSREAGRRGLPASQLAGLHVHFLLATANHARPGDFGVFVTAAEWLDVPYGRLARALLLGELGLVRLQAVEPAALPFDDAATTAAVVAFEVGRRPNRVAFQRVASAEGLGSDAGTVAVPREQLEAEPRWSPLTRPAATARRVPAGHVELGELFRVHRGQVTGANRVWIAGPEAAGLPARFLFASVTRARELIRAGGDLIDPGPLRRVVDLPADLDALDPAEREAVGRFLAWARSLGADRGYVARHRRAWWAVGLREPAPILATYMARRPPAFARNRAGARHINIAHGLYPRAPMAEADLLSAVAHLNAAATLDGGRTYAGGLAKFEPREMERLTLPRPGSGDPGSPGMLMVENSEGCRGPAGGASAIQDSIN